MFNRTLEGHLPDESFFLFGPRQVGKSTLLGKTQTVFAIDLLDPAIQQSYSKDPDLLARQLLAQKKTGMVLIDEIQRVPKLLDVIHGLMEKNPGFKFAMSGSSARKLRHGAANLLGGRALYRTLYPLTLQEMEKHFSLEKVLHFGSLPKIYTNLIEGKLELAQDLLRSYVITYIKEEIKAEALVRNLQGFQNFLDIAAAQFAEQVNFSDLGRQCAVAYATVREYYSILEDTLIGFLLYPYLKSERKRMSHAPKFYFFDNGVLRAISGTLKDPANPIEKGRLFEQWVVQEVSRLNAYYQKDWKLSFWRTSHGAEVDLLLEHGGKIVCAIECKFKKSLSRGDLSGVFAFQEEHPDVPVYVAAPIEVAEKIGDALILPPKQLFDKLLTIGR
ncbi:hypothetical protein A2276_00930 [candidate division WOR-1 bacterium RIFOXYA12_FULL_43_27]|uniref:ATPase n=1 Tax=candidate division WOR-1 bacterium RIFOXYC2_FULL_46_14 TaxID=1802587 RepID=A0A1F4U526_UNCSA|nr:MAG: hypothetical protein A2276_00930 [candidate division WOR-1 bacterium RIFOXYA12_FULL_43_27]OGC20750.1 MAG: hypothetical protein A2292_06945 [candidate division WOR-1 bacterium RIFOXYB2_FULL_46_45]OGC31513.1 MAG: hypothetical protein A2232_04505 [candidate division WOR-1 bacterium RIFOXYA2_FULL_46_56]OGC39920.1 MAG: hypothetical protein A2438_05345 [candidate division WOR-1 bacterium RIFOXYC2_FULL_46_14]